MKYKFFIFTAILFPMLLGACSQKEENIRQLEKLAADMEKQYENYTSEDWESAAKQYAELEKDMKLYDYTDEELREIGRLKGQCAAYLAKARLKMSKEIVHDYMIEIDGAIKGFCDALDGETGE